MYKLNNFYGQTVKVYEKYLHNFQASSLYLAFLISASSFKDYSKGLMKEISKTMGNIEMSLNEVISTETFSIRTVMANPKYDYSSK